MLCHLLQIHEIFVFVEIQYGVICYDAIPSVTAMLWESDTTTNEENITIQRSPYLLPKRNDVVVSFPRKSSQVPIWWLSICRLMFAAAGVLILTTSLFYRSVECSIIKQSRSRDLAAATIKLSAPCERQATINATISNEHGPSSSLSSNAG